MKKKLAASAEETDPRPTWANLRTMLDQWEHEGVVEPSGWYFQMYSNGTVQFALTLKPVLVSQTKTVVKEAE